ncbi:HAD family hydrolase [Peptostreptococcus faecalis]|uniref:HAD family hydrolase n=1 Tax=Peptostreptococcus faecalis TaxID=2045015 RepID=UPI000C7C175A|nr:HAD family hydrolase [Peptostreptococcus faecalis]
MIKHIFCDLDGTLYNEYISNEDFESIKIAQDNGIKFNIATGRVYEHTISIIEELEIDGYLICENGAYIYNQDRECIYKRVMNNSQIKKIIDFYYKLKYIDNTRDTLYFKYDGNVVIPKDIGDLDYFSKGYTIDETIIKREKYNDLVGNIGFFSTDSEILDKLVVDYSELFGSKFDVYKSSETTVNIVPKGVSKFEAIKYICKIEDISLDTVVTIGDSPNDISMLRNIKMSFSMSNSDESVKSVAGFNTPSVANAVNMVIDFNNEIENMIK